MDVTNTITIVDMGPGVPWYLNGGTWLGIGLIVATTVLLARLGRRGVWLALPATLAIALSTIFASPHLFNREVSPLKLADALETYFSFFGLATHFSVALVTVVLAVIGPIPRSKRFAEAF